MFSSLSWTAGNLVYDGERYGYVSYWYTPGAELAVYDLDAFPQAPVAIYDAAGDAHVSNMAIGEDRLYLLTGGDWSFEILDISHPEEPTRIADLALPIAQYGDIGEFDVQDGYAFLARSDNPSRDGGLLVLDLTNEAAPEVAAMVTLPDVGGIPYRGLGLDVEGDRAVLTTKTGIYVFDVSDPQAPQIVVDPTVDAAFRFPDEYLPSKGGYVQIVDDLAYVTAYADVDSPDMRSGGLAIFQLPPVDTIL